MKLPYVLRQLGLLFLGLSVAVLLTAGLSFVLWLGHERSSAHALAAAGITAVIGGVVGLVLMVLGRHSDPGQLGRREALLLVALTWLLGAAHAALPFWLWALLSPAQDPAHPFSSFIDCYFEAASGLTTTGASVLSDIAALPPSLLLWRSVTHWLGGLGIVVLFVAVLPTLGVGGKRLFQVEAPGPKAQGVRPRIQETARTLWQIYLGLTAAQFILLRLAGLSWFDSLNHTFATLATGGFSTHNASLGDDAFNGFAHTVVIVFMILAGLNFGLYYHLLRQQTSRVLRDPELRGYLAILAGASAIVVLGLWWAGQPLVRTDGTEVPATAAESLRHGVFQVVSIQTTTGFGTADFDRWPDMCKAVLVALMFVGGCAGSTGGGIKVVRVLMAGRLLLGELDRVFRPNRVQPLRLGTATVSPEQREATLAYVLSILVLFGLGTVLIAGFEAAAGQPVDAVTALTASAATLNNIGPGLHLVGPTENFGFFSPMSKLIMCLLMVLGRLEVYTLLVLLSPAFWRRD